MIIVLLMLPVLIGFAALAVEGGLWYADRHELRAIADAAVLAAAWARAEGENETDAAADEAEAMGLDDTMDVVELNSPPEFGVYAGDVDAIEVIVTRTRPLMLSTLFLESSDIDIVMRAVANLSGGNLGEACVLALDDDADSAIDVFGNGDIALEGCGVMANSDSDTAVTVSGSATLEADYLATVGNYSISKPQDSNIGTFNASASALTDPFASFTPAYLPSVPADCDYSNEWSTGGSGSTASPPAGSVFCDGFTIKNNVELESGTYYITGGSLSFTANANVTATGPVTFVLTDDATVDIRGGATVDLSAPTSGEYNGLLFFSTSTNADTIKINGGASMSLDGALYFRNQDLVFQGNNSTSGGCLRIIAQTVSFGGGAGLGADCSAYNLPPMTPSGNDPRLVE